MTAAYTGAASVANKWPELKFRTADADVVLVTGTWLRPGEGDNNLMAREWIERMGEEEAGP